MNVGYRQLAQVPPPDLKVPVLGHLAFGAASARRCSRTRVHRPLRVDPPNVDIGRTVEPAAGVGSGAGVTVE